MELEDAKQMIEELQESVGKLENKNKELLNEKRKAQAKLQDFDADEYARNLDRLSELESKEAELTKQVDTLTQQNKQLEEMAQTKDSNLKNYLTESNLTEALAKANVRPEFMDAAKALLKSQVNIAEDDSGMQVLLGEKSVAEAVSEWAQSDQGKHFVSAPQNSGGGTRPSGTGAAGKRFDQLSSSELVELRNNNPQEYTRLKEEFYSNS